MKIQLVSIRQSSSASQGSKPNKQRNADSGADAPPPVR